MRIYDPRIARFLSVDPITKQYPELTPYQFSSNSPIENIDLDGLEAAKPSVDKKTLFLTLPAHDPDGDQIGFIRNARQSMKDEHPIKAAILDFTVSLADQIGLNTFDNAYHKEGKLTKGEKISVGLAVFSILTTPKNGKGNSKSSPTKLPNSKVNVEAPTAPTSRAARRQVMRDNGIPTSQQPASQSRNASGREYGYEVFEPYGILSKKSVQQQTLDSSHPGQPHWEAGKVKTDNGKVRLNDHGRPKLENKDKAKVNY